MRVSCFILLSLCALSSRAQIVTFAKIYQQPFTIAQQGDYQAGVGMTAAMFTNAINAILYSNLVPRVTAYVSPGDLYEQATNADSHSAGAISTVDMTNQLYRLKNAGIPVIVCNGNHDADLVNVLPGTNWNDVFGTNFYSGESGFVGTRTNGDSKNLIFAQTNGLVKLLFLTYYWDNGMSNYLHDGTAFYSNVFVSSNAMMAGYLPQTQWMTNELGQYPNHNGIVISHFLLNIATNLSSVDGRGGINIGPSSEEWLDGLKFTKNAALAVSGHTRGVQQTLCVRKQMLCDDAHVVQGITFNQQSGTNNGSQIVFYIFQPNEGTIHMRTYDSYFHRFLTNNEATGPGVNGNQEFDATFPLLKPF